MLESLEATCTASPPSSPGPPTVWTVLMHVLENVCRLKDIWLERYILVGKLYLVLFDNGRLCRAPCCKDQLKVGAVATWLYSADHMDSPK